MGKNKTYLLLFLVPLNFLHRTCQHKWRNGSTE